MNNLNKIFKWLMLALILIGVGILVWGFVSGYPSTPGAEDKGTVDALLYCAYAFVGIAIFCIVVIGIAVSAANNPKSLLKLCIGLVAIAVVCFIVYKVSSGAPAVGLLSDQPDGSTLKLTDTVLNLTYLVGGVAILSIVFGEIFGAIRNK